MKNLFFLFLVLLSEIIYCKQIYKNNDIAIYNDYPVWTFEIFGPEVNLLKAAFIKKPYEFSSSDNSLKINCSSSLCRINLFLTSKENIDVRIPFIEQNLSTKTCNELIKKIKPALYRFDNGNLELSFLNNKNCTITYLNLSNYSNRKIDKAYDEFLKYKKSQLDKVKNFSGNIKDIVLIKNKLQVMVNIDQKVRRMFGYYYFQDKQKTIDKVYCRRELQKKLFFASDDEHNSELKKLLNKYNWFSISKFGKEADKNGWLLVQHQDNDLKFQKMILKRLKKLYPIGETSKANYAYLYDRIAVVENKPQKYGTQGECIGKGLWKPDPLEDAKRVDEFRQEMGLEPLAEYKKNAKSACMVHYMH
jgi:hypothetical protein